MTAALPAPASRPAVLTRRRPTILPHRVAVALAAVAVVAAACGGGSNSASPEAPTTDTPGNPSGQSQADLAAVDVKLEEVGDLPQAIALAVRPGDDALYVARKSGQVRRVAHGQGGGDASVDGQPVLDLSGSVSTGSEQGLLGLAFSPDGNRLYVDYTDRTGDTQVVEYAYADGRADPGSRRLVLSVDQPYANHNGGQVAFGPDGKLYVGLGDGGSEEDPDGIGQNLGTLLAKILRLDPQPSGDKGYRIPPDNPFVGRPGAAPETFVWGLRNPWRFSWDADTGDLWIGDVGQNTYEEIDFLAESDVSGANLGWSGMEGLHRFKGGNPPGGVLPVAEYSHAGGNCSVTGGYVYRGSRIDHLQGAYVYGDYCSGRVWALVQEGGRQTGRRQLDVGGSHRIYSFGQDANNELYLLADDGLFRIEPA